MPRKPRQEVPDGIYHVTARGNRQQRIFRMPDEFAFYLSLLSQARERFGLRVIAYALLPNHLHLLVRRSNDSLARAMYHVQRTFAVWRNRRYGQTGHLFQDRYFARLCEDEGYLWAVVRYVHQNPVEAGLAASVQDYPWTSYHAYATQDWGVVDPTEALALLGTARAVLDVSDIPGASDRRGTPARSAKLDA
ncbi:MAG: transposase [Armatimonadota bacterium]|nr:transposase [Armatimonadota bacterium]MDR5696546.1 transposase [Armatimonadota bacterium]